MLIERLLQGTLSTLITEVIQERGLQDYLHPYVATEDLAADITIRSSSGKPLFFLELKDPEAKDGKSVFNSDVLLREVQRAQKAQIPYFGTCNFLTCAFFDRDKLFERVAVSDVFLSRSILLRQRQNYAPNRELLSGLRQIADFYVDRAVEIINKKQITFNQPDELYIFQLRHLIEYYEPSISDSVWHQFHHDPNFRKAISDYARGQQWNIPTERSEIEKITYISLLMLVSKLIFYKSYIDLNTWAGLAPMHVSHEVSDAQQLQQEIWRYFDLFRERSGNFELLIGAADDIVFRLPFCSNACVDLVRDLLEAGNRYDLAKIPYDIIGRIFEELIRHDERHKLGQYFTPPAVIDLINAFSIHQANDVVFDPSCGSGTFLVRAYERKKAMLSTYTDQPNLVHQQLLNEIYGNDISGYPAYLSTLNLAIRNARSPSHPRIINRDFFALHVNTKISVSGLDALDKKEFLPLFDAIIGNPPYTRQEDIGSINGALSKDKITERILAECHFVPSQRTSIYALFFYHALVFLKEGGYLAFICQNSWLDTEYGIEMQRFILNHFEIIAIIDSEVERFFPSASVNTTIVVLRKQSGEKERDANMARFVYLRQPLETILTTYNRSLVKNDSATNDEQPSRHPNRANAFHDALVQLSLTTETPYFQSTCLRQADLRHHQKWGKFLKAPAVYFEISEKINQRAQPLSGVASVKFGIKTGCNEYFILRASSAKPNLAINYSEESDLNSMLQAGELIVVENGLNEVIILEKEALGTFLASPKELNKLSADAAQLENYLFVAKEDLTDIKVRLPYSYRYIKHGIQLKVHLRSTCASRKRWYQVPIGTVPPMSFNHIINEVGRVFDVTAYSSNNFYHIFPKERKKTIWLYLNSTIFWLEQQLMMKTNLGDGAGRIETFQLEEVNIPNIDLEHEPITLSVIDSYKELLEISNQSVRYQLDDLILQKLGFTSPRTRKKLLSDLYQATFHLINSRLKKANSQKNTSKTRNKIDFQVYVEQLKSILATEKVHASNSKKFSLHLKKTVQQITSQSSLQKKILDTYWREKFNEAFNETATLSKSQIKMF
ncbi:MAG: N-6 DNA methylase [Chitinophagales bacterium]